MTTWPTRGQQAPNFWDVQLKDYIDESTVQAVVAAAPATYRVWEHGLVGDWVGNDANGTGTNDTAALVALAAAVPAGSTILFDRTKRYRLDPTTYTKPLTFDFDGAVVVTRTQTVTPTVTEEAFIRFDGAFTAAYAISAAAKGDIEVTCTTSGNANQFAPGEVVQIRDAGSLLRWDTGASFSNLRVEMAIVRSVGSGKVRLNAPLSRTFDTTPEIVKQSAVARPQVRNIGMLYDTDPGVVMSGSQRAHIFRFFRCAWPLVENVNVNGWQGVFTQFEYCVGGRVKGGKIEFPFRPDQGGHGHSVRQIYSSDGCTAELTTIGARHTSNYVHALRCGSRFCVAYNSVTTAYQTHGWESIDSYSFFDTDVSENHSGWSLGNPEYGSDAGYDIVGPRYYGTGRGVLARSKSSGLRVSLPHIRSFGAASCGVLISAGATDSVVDTNGGTIETDGFPVKAIADAGEGSAPVGDVTLIGAGWRGTGVMSISIAGDLSTTGVPVAVLGAPVHSGNGGVIPRQSHAVEALTGFRPGTPGSNTSPWNAANEGAWARVDVGGKISKIGFHVITPSGNISVAVFRGVGSGLSRVPDTRVATSGAVACPAAGYQEVSLGATVDVLPGDFLFMSCDNSTAIFQTINGFASALNGGSFYRKGTAHPAPATAGAMVTSSVRIPFMVGT